MKHALYESPLKPQPREEKTSFDAQIGKIFHLCILDPNTTKKMKEPNNPKPERRHANAQHARYLSRGRRRRRLR